MYYIIGADGRQYGPISLEQVRQWLIEGRANANTLVKPEGATDWKALATFPELAASIPPVAPPPLRPPSTVSDRASMKVPAGICGILFGSFGVHKFLLGYNSAGIIMLASTLASFFLGIVTCGLLWPAITVIHVIGVVEGILYLSKSDEEFVRTYVDGRKEWF